MRPALLPLTIFAASFGLEEAIIVLYLRRLTFPHDFFAGGPSAVGAAPPAIIHLELAREASTIITLVALAWLCAHTVDLRWRSFLFAFGLWDAAYYAWLYLLSGYPTVTSEDLLFLIPVPWVAPVWVALAFALSFAALGAFGFRKQRTWIFVVGLGLGLASFIVQPLGVARAYPLWLFLPAIALILAALSPARAGAREEQGSVQIR
jgi:hypothetical protein